MKYKTLFFVAAALMASTAIVTAAPTAKMTAAVADSARPEADTKRDENRKPAEMLEFGGITPGKVVVIVYVPFGSHPDWRQSIDLSNYLICIFLTLSFVNCQTRYLKLVLKSLVN